MDFQPLNVAEIKRIEESVNKGSAKIAELVYMLENGAQTTRWENPLPEVSSHLNDARSALDQLCNAHRQAIESVKAQENKVLQQNKERAEELRAKQVSLDEREERLEKLEERQKVLDEKEERLEKKLEEVNERKGRQKQKDEEQRRKDEEQRTKDRELAESRRTLDESKKAHWTEEGRVAGVLSILKTVRATANEESNEHVGLGARLVAKESSLDELSEAVFNQSKETKQRQDAREERLNKREDELEKYEKVYREASGVQITRLIDGLNEIAQNLGTFLGASQETSDELNVKLNKQSTALDVDAGKLRAQSASVDSVSEKLSGLNLNAVSSLLEEVGRLDTWLSELSSKAGYSVDEVERMVGEQKAQIEKVDEQLKAFIKMTEGLPAMPPTAPVPGRELEPRSTLEESTVESEEQAHVPGTPASEKRKREEGLAKGRKRLSTGLDQPPPSRGSESSGRETATEVQFGGPLVLNMDRPLPPVQPMPPPPLPPPPPPPAQPVQSSSSASTAPPAPTQVPTWVSTEEVSAEIRPVWSRLEFSNPGTWTAAQVTAFQELLKRFQGGNRKSRPVLKLATCAELQGNGTETCYQVKSQNNSSTFDINVDTACNRCRTGVARPCFRITRGVAKEWLVTVRQP